MFINKGDSISAIHGAGSAEPQLREMAIVLQCQLPRMVFVVLKRKLEEHWSAESPSIMLQGLTAIAALSLIAQTRRDDGPNVKTTLCVANARKCGDGAHG